MYRTLRKWRLDALYGLDLSGSAGASACRGFKPMNPAPCGATHRIKDRRSLKSPMPQLPHERSVYSCTAIPHNRPPALIGAGSKQRGGETISRQRSALVAAAPAAALTAILASNS